MDNVVHMGLVIPSVVLVGRMAVDMSFVFLAIDNDADLVAFDDLLTGQIVVDPNTMSLLMDHEVLEVVCPCCGYFFGL